MLTAESRATECERESRELRDRLHRVETAMPMVLVAQRIDDFEKLSDLFDLLVDPLVISSPANEGNFVWANNAFCEALGRSREQILSINWRGLIHPDDLRPTAAAETTAWDEPIWGFANRYIAADGRVVWFRWYCPQYSRGATLALAREVKPEGTAPRFLIRASGK
ncbi:MAG TPA: PAS domain-containing protein [Vicinamibacterales bacterium]|nr:PAS domain-containing protein [Vicinamibacterales bacterium]